MKDIDDGTGNKSDRVKLIRASSIGNYSWDMSDSSVNGGAGVNEWSQADLMKLLNPGYESESVGGSLYWNSRLGSCYTNSQNVIKACDFTGIGIKQKLKNLIGDAVWNTGTNGANSWNNGFSGLTKHFYTYERSDDNGKTCTSSDSCNDTVERTTAWTGKVGLMYPSDYGYATSGGSTTDRSTCLNIVLVDWDNYSECNTNDWLFNNNDQWTLSPSALSSQNNFAFYVSEEGFIFDGSTVFNYSVRPVVYLSQSVFIQSGDGSSSDPFILGN